MDDTYQVIMQNRETTPALGTIPAPSLVFSPSTRGAMDIIWSCVITPFACVFTVLHLNIPAITKKYALINAKIRWALVAIIFPDIIFILAYSQFLAAQQLKKKLDRLRGKLPNMIYIARKYGLQICFFVVMGGFHISIEDIKPGANFTQREDIPYSLPVTPKGFLKLIELGQLEELSRVKESHCGERSKANYLQKTLVAFQVCWMGIQCGARAAQGLPITLLEFHTLAHVLYIPFLAWLWFHKPLDISHPEILEPRSETTKNFMAYAIQIELCKSASAFNKLACFAPEPVGVAAVVCEVVPPPIQNVNHEYNTVRSFVVTYTSSRLSAGPEGLQGFATTSPPASYDRTQPLLALGLHQLPKPTRWVPLPADDSVTLSPGEALPCGLGLATSTAPAPSQELNLTQKDCTRLERATSYLYSLPAPAKEGLRYFKDFVPSDSERCLSDGGNALFQASERQDYGFFVRLLWFFSGVSPQASFATLRLGHFVCHSGLSYSRTSSIDTAATAGPLVHEL
ncbi:hypothetical protein CMUS01_05136 [Colletotrichum musicola]|uniref:Uncharacterized protein n=1 Tax=Colletotrichum musicola TaxID=2175873 RepID=A0A8H6KTX4_9PEZI|nr:hypothetical protein CMUS01_05136 [Colletotrichum musicola]